MELTDQVGSQFGIPSNPVATNQLVGTPVYATATSSTGAAISASLPAVAGKTTYINGFVAGVDATAAFSNFVTLSLDGGTTTHMNFTLASTTSVPGQVNIDFPDPIPAKSANTTIVVSILVGAGGTSKEAISVFGYQL